MQCPRCGSTDTAKCGRSRQDKQRYWCAACQTSFTENYDLGKPPFTSGSRKDRWDRHWPGEDRRYEEEEDE